MRRRVAAILVAILVAAVAWRWMTSTRLRRLEPSSAAAKYLGEFLHAEAHPVDSAAAPNGSAEASWQAHRSWLPLIGTDSCHTLWLTKRDAAQSRQKVLTAEEGDPGSGLSFNTQWSSDSSALFVTGPHSGIDCRRFAEAGALRIIYTLSDEVAWEVPPDVQQR